MTERMPTDEEVRRAWEAHYRSEARLHFWIAIIVYIVLGMAIAGVLIFGGIGTSFMDFAKLSAIIAFGLWALDMLMKIPLWLFGMVKDQPLTVGNVIILGLAFLAVAAAI
jgi:hypothetical protein